MQSHFHSHNYIQGSIFWSSPPIGSQCHQHHYKMTGPVKKQMKEDKLCFTSGSALDKLYAPVLHISISRKEGRTPEHSLSLKRPLTLLLALPYLLSVPWTTKINLMPFPSLTTRNSGLPGYLSLNFHPN